MSALVGQTRKPFTTAAYQYIRSTDKLPTTDQARALEDPLLRVKLFNPNGQGTWWIAGFDPETCRAWGVAELFEREVGDFDMGELVAARGIFGLPLERDLWFKSTRLSDVLR